MSCLICDRVASSRAGKNPYLVAEYETGYLVIGDHQYFYGYSLFLAKAHITDLHLLDRETRTKHLTELGLISEALAKAFPADKYNIELLGNGDAHLHWHLFPRRHGDLGTHGRAGKGPVWWLPFDQMMSDQYRVAGEQLQQMVKKLQKAIQENK